MSVRFRFFYNCMRILCVPILFLISFITPVLSSNNLPSGYTELEYIESTGTQWIDTGLIVNFTNLTLEYKYRKTSALTQNPLGADLLSGVRLMHGNVYNKNLYYGNSSVVTDIPQSLNTDYEVKFEISNALGYGKWTINGTEYSNSSKGLNGWTDTNTATQTLTDSLFRTNAPESKGYLPMTGRLYYTRYYNNGTQVRNFIPAKRNSDSVIGMYDMVNNTFYTNSGTGTFTAGPEVEKPEIKIATTSYVESAFADSVTELNTAISTVKSVVDNTIIQADRIGKLYTGKQTRPSDTCPDGAECLLITEADGSLHWYPICNADGSVGTSGSSSNLASAWISKLTSGGNPGGHGYFCKALSTDGTSYPLEDYHAMGGIYRTLGTAGDWAVVYQGTEATDLGEAVIYGTSACNSTSGTYKVASSDNQTNSGGQYCWCKMTEIGTGTSVYPASGALWVFGIDYVNADRCAYNCAKYCAGTVQISAGFRGAVVGSGN